MATFPLSTVMQSNGLVSGADESANLVSAAYLASVKRVAQWVGKLDMERNLIFGRVALNGRNSSFQKHRFKVLASSCTFSVQNPRKISKYLFWSDIGDHVKVHVERKKDMFSVYVEVSSLEPRDHEDELLMSWGIYRSDSSSFIPMDFQSSTVASAQAMETPLLWKSSSQTVVELDFEANLVPFYLSFILKSLSDNGSTISEIRSHRKTNFCVPVGFNSGYPAPLGLSFSTDGSMNFALFSRSAEKLVLCLYGETTIAEPALEIDLDPYVNRTGDIWHALINSTIPLVRYGYRCKKGTQQKPETFHSERVLLDPYAKIIEDLVPAQGDSGLLSQCLGQLQMEPAFDWTGDVRLCLPLEKLVVYRLNVMRFTRDVSSKLPDDVKGTFSGISEKLQHFKNLGMNAILLEPIFPSDDQQGPYFPLHFFSPMNIYGPPGSPLSTIRSMKEMVKSLHVNGIEVLMEVVFTHTAEVGALREIDNSSYHFVDEGDGIGKYALKCNFPIVQHLILDSLRYWVIEFHIDGFCFVNAASLLRGHHGEDLSRPPLVEAIAFDPILSKVKIIADTWDPRDADTKAVRFPHWKRWAEMNAHFCNDVRNFLRGESLLSNLATRLCGSGDKFSDGRGPAFSFNFIARNFGLSLVDLVSFSDSGDLASELSWNCGEEGATTDNVILETRLKQIRNFLFILFVSLGIPVLNMGDECGQSNGGSPAYADRKVFNWSFLKTSFAIQTTEFISFLSSLRTRRSDLLQRRDFLKAENIDWHGTDLSPPSWKDPSSKFLGMRLKVHEEETESSPTSANLEGDLFLAFNAADYSESIALPPPPADMAWVRLVDTALSYPEFFSVDGDPILDQTPELVTYEMKSHSCVLFEARSPGDQQSVPAGKTSNSLPEKIK